MPISRYQNFSTVKDPKTGKRRLETFPSISGGSLKKPSDIIIELSDAERIDVIAQQHLGAGQYWWIICLLNNLEFPLGSKVSAGTILRIPASVDDFINAIKIKKGFG